MKKPQETNKDLTTPLYRIDAAEDHVVVHAPYNREFIEMARVVGGTYSPADKTWSFYATQKAIVEKMCAFAFEGKGTRVGMRQSIAKTMASISRSLPGAAGIAFKFGVVAVALGMNGIKGMYTLQSLAGLAKGMTPKVPRPFRPKGVGTDYGPMNIGGQELFLERSRAGLER